MISQLKDVPANIVAFRVTGKVEKEDFQQIVMPAVDDVVERTGELNFVLVMDTALKNFTAGAWLQDIVLGIKKLTKWNRVAVVTHSEGIIKFTHAFSVIAPGEYRGYLPEEYELAVSWVSKGEVKVE
jgi:hypothetical protein